MKRLSKFIVSLAFLVFALPLSSLAAQFKVTRVYDGDTIHAEISGTEIKVRLVGIDAPETSDKKGEEGQPYSQEAKKHLAGLILHKVVDIKDYGMDSDHRVLGEVFFDGKNINLEMVKAGLAEVFTGENPKDLDLEPYRLAETKAREARTEMWTQFSKG